MCFLTTIIKIKEDRNVDFSVAKMLAEEQSSNSDGSASYCFNKKGNEFYESRKMTQTPESILENVYKYDVCNFHFRKSTGGTVDTSNVHFWTIGDWTFAHNGTIHDLKDEKKCDSLVFFEKLIKKHLLKPNGYADIKGIRKYTAKTTLWGRFIIINKKSKEIYFFGDFHVYSLNRSSIIVTSSKVSFESSYSILNINFPIDTTMEELETEIDGVHSYNSDNGFSIHFATLKDFNNYQDYQTYDEYFKDTEYGNGKKNKETKVLVPVKEIVSEKEKREIRRGFGKIEHSQDEIEEGYINQLQMEVDLDEGYSSDLAKIELNYAKAVKAIWHDGKEYNKEKQERLNKVDKKYVEDLEALDVLYFGAGNATKSPASVV